MAVNTNDDPTGVIPDGQAPLGTDASDDMAQESDSQLDGAVAAPDLGDGDNDESDSGNDVVQQLLNYGRQKYGLGGEQQAGNIPAVPAGPGGDKPQDNPFGTKTPNPPFGKRNGVQSFEDGGAVEDDDQMTTGVIPDGEDNRYPEVNAIKGALNAQGKADAETAGVIADPEGISDGLSALKQGAQEGMQKIGGMISDGLDALNQEPTTPNPAQQAAGYLGEKAQQLGGVIADQLQQFPKNARAIMSYLTGDAAHGQEVAKAEQMANPDGSKSPSQTKMDALVQAAKSGNPEAGWRLLQAYRQKYEAMRHSAAAVADGGDHSQAAQLATQAYTNLPDGLDVHFVNSRNGVTATVTQGDKVISQVPLSTQGFRQFLTDPKMQFDNALSTSPVVALQQAAQQGKQAFAGTPSGKEVPFPGTEGQTPQQPDQDLQYGGRRDLEKIAHQLFPMVSQSAQRNAWIASQYEKGQQYASQENQAAEKGAQSTRRAEIAAGWHRDVAKMNTDQRRDAANQHYGEGGAYDRRTAATAANKAAELAARQGNAQMAAQLRLAGNIMNNPMSDPKDVAKARELIERNTGGQQAPAQQSAPQQGQQQGQQNYPPAPPLNQRQTNQVYQTPKGPARWMGNGWQALK
jgi:hypothetical protein